VSNLCWNIADPPHITSDDTLTGLGMKKAPKRISESPWSLHMRSFWKITFINPPEG
jgi:hypothetical protein